MTLGPADRLGVERLVEQVVFGPLDLTIRLVQDAPEAVDRARRQLVLARFIGKLAVDQGAHEVRRRLDLLGGVEHERPGNSRATCSPSRLEAPGRPDDGRPDVSDADVSDADVSDSDVSDSDVSDSDRATPGVSSGPAADELALPDYEQLPAADIVAKLAGLSQSDRDAIVLFEANHRNRRTVLGKLDQLRSS